MHPFSKWTSQFAGLWNIMKERLAIHEVAICVGWNDSPLKSVLQSRTTHNHRQQCRHINVLMAWGKPMLAKGPAPARDIRIFIFLFSTTLLCTTGKWLFLFLYASSNSCIVARDKLEKNGWDRRIDRFLLGPNPLLRKTVEVETI